MAKLHYVNGSSNIPVGQSRETCKKISSDNTNLISNLLVQNEEEKKKVTYPNSDL